MRSTELDKAGGEGKREGGLMEREYAMGGESNRRDKEIL